MSLSLLAACGGTPKAQVIADIYHGRRGDVLTRREEAKQRTLQARKEHNRNLRELDKGNLTG